MPTISMEVSDTAYDHLKVVAVEQGQSVSDSATDAIEAIPGAARRNYEETCAAIERGLMDMEAGRHYSLEEAWQRLDARRAEREKFREAHGRAK